MTASTCLAPLFSRGFACPEREDSKGDNLTPFPRTPLFLLRRRYKRIAGALKTSAPNPQKICVLLALPHSFVRQVRGRNVLAFPVGERNASLTDDPPSAHRSLLGCLIAAGAFM